MERVDGVAFALQRLLQAGAEGAFVVDDFAVLFKTFFLSVALVVVGWRVFRRLEPRVLKEL